MRKLILVLAMFVVAGTVSAAPFNWKSVMGRRIDSVVAAELSAMGSNVVANAADISTRAVTVVDTNAVTTVKNFTPAAKGAVLVGTYNTGTNGLWVAFGTTTNDWKLIYQGDK